MLWLLGLVTGTTMGGFIHVLLVIAIVMVLLRIISGRKPIYTNPREPIESVNTKEKPSSAYARLPWRWWC